MGTNTKIEFCDSSVNGVMGCDGCELWNKKVRTCYAGNMTARYAGRNGWPESFDKPEVFPNRIDKACTWSDLTGKTRSEKPWLNGMPRVIFLNDMSDTFTDSLPFDWLMPYVDKMIASPHIWLFLTKRSSRMAQFFDSLGYVPDNFWLGATITDQRTADKRLPELLNIPASKHFLSIEPLLGAVDLGAVGSVGFGQCLECFGSGYTSGHYSQDDGVDFCESCNGAGDGGEIINWVIVGGESGKDARPLHPDWVRSLRDQCVDAGVPFFFKQWGEYQPTAFPEAIAGEPFLHRFRDGNSHGFTRVGKKRAGCLLDGLEWKEFLK